MNGRGRPQDRWPSDGERGRRRGYYYSGPPHEFAHPSQSSRERPNPFSGVNSDRRDETHYLHGISGGYGRERERERESSREARDRSREPRYENYRTGSDATSSRSSGRSNNFPSRVVNRGNDATPRWHAHDQPMGWNESHRLERSGNGRGDTYDVSRDRNENRRAVNSAAFPPSGSISRRQAREEPINWDTLRAGSSNATSDQQFGGQSRNRREIDSSEKRALAERSGLVAGNHQITRIIPTKPDATASKQGTSGVPVKLVANYFRVTKRSTWELYLYRVDFSPEIENKAFRSGLLHDQINNHGRYIFDGTMLYMLAKFDKDVTEFLARGNKDDQTYTIKIKLAGLVPPDTYQYLHVWASLLRKCESTLGLQLVGRNYYSSERDKIKTIHQYRLELWPGFVTAIHQHERDILLCVNTSTKVMRTDTVYDIMINCGGNRENFQNKILGMTVLTTYSNKTFRISDIDFQQSPSDEFTLKTGEKVSFVKYFKKKYDKTIRYPNQPLLIVRSSQRQKRAGQSDIIALVPELCRPTGFDDEMRNNKDLMAKVAETTRMDPAARMQKSQSLIKLLHGNEKSRQIFKDYNFQVEATPTQLTGRRLLDETVILGKDMKFQTRDWSQKFHNNEMYGSHHLRNWALIYPNEATKATKGFVTQLQNVAAGMKYLIENPYLHELPFDNGPGYMNALNKARNRDPQLIVCVLRRTDENLYGSIKKYCIENAIPSQILVSRTFNKQGLSVATKVVIQMNCKLGGVPWMVTIPQKGLMTIGFDVSHNIKDKRKKSCGAIVATWYGMDQEIGKLMQKYYSAVSAHISGNELSSDIALSVCQAVREYFNEHNAPPESILFYRDGVGEGQIPYVKEIEIQNIIDGLRGYYGDAKVPLTFIVVTKQLNTRFFVNNRGNYENPQPGTVVDDVITMPEKQEFFLVSSYCKQGVVSPTCYNVLLNHMNLSSDALQTLTYKFTYLYYNWCGTVTVPAVVQYARKLAYLVGNFGLTPPSNDLQKRLYFL